MGPVDKRSFDLQLLRPLVRVEPLTDQYAEREGAGGLRSREIFDFAINGPASMRGGYA